MGGAVRTWGSLSPPRLRCPETETGRKAGEETKLGVGARGGWGPRRFLPPAAISGPACRGGAGVVGPPVSPFHLLQVSREKSPAKLKLSGVVWSLKHLPEAKLAARKFKACVGEKKMCRQSRKSLFEGGKGCPGEQRAALFPVERLLSCLVNN